jgi:hypothetical protein
VIAVEREELVRDDLVMRMTRCLAAGLVLWGLGACALSPDHMMGIEGGLAPSHPWHEVPAKVGMMIVFVPLALICSPLIAIEELTGSGSVLHEAKPGISTYIVAPPSMAAGYLLALPFFLLGLPLEIWGPKTVPPPSEQVGAGEGPGTSKQPR